MEKKREVPIILPAAPRPGAPDDPQKEIDPYKPNRPLPDVPEEPQPEPDEPEI